MSLSGNVELVLVGAGGTAADVLALIAHINARRSKYVVRGVLDDRRAVGEIFCGVRVLGPLRDGARQEHARFVDCLGSPGSFTRRESILTKNGLDSFPFESIIHPSAVVAPDATVGVGSILFPGVVVLSKVDLAEHVTVLSNCVLNHEVSVGRYAILASGVNLSGQVRVGECAYLGSGACVREGRTIGRHAMVGMGSMVVRDVPDGMLVAGNPARPVVASE